LLTRHGTECASGAPPRVQPGFAILRSRRNRSPCTEGAGRNPAAADETLLVRKTWQAATTFSRERRDREGSPIKHRENRFCYISHKDAIGWAFEASRLPRVVVAPWRLTYSERGPCSSRGMGFTATANLSNARWYPEPDPMATLCQTQVRDCCPTHWQPPLLIIYTSAWHAGRRDILSNCHWRHECSGPAPGRSLNITACYPRGR